MGKGKECQTGSSQARLWCYVPDKNGCNEVQKGNRGKWSTEPCEEFSNQASEKIDKIAGECEGEKSKSKKKYNACLAEKSGVPLSTIKKLDTESLMVEEDEYKTKCKEKE